MNKLLLCLLSACTAVEERSVSTIDIEMEALFEIRSDSAAWFAFPSFLVTDSTGNIIVGDRRRQELTVFDSNGQFQHTIGGEGRGPAEFQQVRGLGIDRDDNLLVYDAESMLVKRFTVDGTLISTHKLSEPVSSSIDFLQSGKHHLLFHALYNPGAEKNYLMHRYAQDFDSLVANELAIQELKEFENPGQVVSFMSADKSSQLLLPGERLLFAPGVYGGILTEYPLMNEDQTGSAVRTYEGVSYMKPYTLVRNASEDTYADVTRHTRGTVTKYLIHNMSKGLFRLNSGKIIHFTYIEREDGSERVLGAELFDQEIDLIGYGEICQREYRSDPNARNVLRWNIAWKDSNDRFYIIDRTGEPKIRVVRFNFGEP